MTIYSQLIGDGADPVSQFFCSISTDSITLKFLDVNIILATSMVMKELFPAVAFRVDRESDGNTSAFAQVYVNTGS